MTRFPSDTVAVRRRYLALVGLRWLPTGLLVPVIVLLLLDRGLSLGQLGLVFAAQGLMVLLLELPTGGLADAIGRRRVLLMAGIFDTAAIALLTVADTLPALALVFGLQGIYRALESGPLDSWYVDTAQGLDTDADIEGGLSRAGAVLGVAIATGALASSALVALEPISSVDPLVTPLLAALALRAVELTAIWTLMSEPSRSGGESVRQSVSQVPTIVATAISTVRASSVLIALVAVEFLWGFGMMAVEGFTPAKLGVELGSSTKAAALLGPLSTVAWLVAAGGAGLVPLLTRRWSPAVAGAMLRIGQGITVLGLALAAGPIGIVIAYVLTMGIHGAANPVHQGMLHRAVLDPQTRATVVSVNSLTAQSGGMLGGIALGALADATSLTVAIAVGAATLAAPAYLYVIAGRNSRRDAAPTAELSTDRS